MNLYLMNNFKKHILKIFENINKRSVFADRIKLHSNYEIKWILKFQ